MNSPTEFKRLNKLKRREKAYELRMQGKNLLEIARAVGVSTTTISQDIKAAHLAYLELHRETQIEVTNLDLARIDKLMDVYWDRALGGDDKSAKFVLDLLKQRARIFGYEARQKFEVALGSTEDLDPVQVVAKLKELCGPTTA